VASRPSVLPLASRTNHLRLISLPLGMVVDIFGLLPDSAVFLVRRGSEEYGSKLVVRDYLLHTSKFEQKNDCSRTERRGEGRVWFSLHKTRKKPALAWIVRSGLGDLDSAQNRWDGCFRDSYDESCSPVDPSDPSRMPRVTAWPGNNKDTDVQTRDCARFKSTEAFGDSQGLMMEFTGFRAGFEPFAAVARSRI
jgi:hypothetical protein